MEFGDETGEHLNHGGRGGLRWHDSTKMVWTLISAIAFMIAAWGAIVYLKASSAEIKNAEQDVYIRVLLDNDRVTQQKLDQIIQRLK
jgi:hypothetical protein